MASSDAEMPDAHMSAHISLSAPPDDPELHSVVTDFVDYTEYLPSDLIRSLTLIRNLDERYQDACQQVHEHALALCKPTQDAAELRKKMSRALKQATIYREAACAEANRLNESAQRNAKRLTLIRKKLQGLPMPPSRDPTPVPVVSPVVRKETEKAMKLTLHLDDRLKKMRHRRVLVPGEVMPPPSASDEAYTHTEYSSADDMDDGGEVVVIESRGRKTGLIKLKVPKDKKQKLLQPIKSNSQNRLGTNVHSQVAGISTSNALAMLTPPPPDAKPGSKWMPWFKLTEFEMATLRKAMKKNAVWTPSETMIRRHLKDNKRGPEFYEAAKEEAEANGEELIDEDPIDPTKELGPGEVAPNLPSGQSQALENRGMRLNVAKKEKAIMRRAEAEREAAEAAAAGLPVPTIEPSSAKKSKKDKGVTEKTPVSKKDAPRRSGVKRDKLQRAISSIDDLQLDNLFSSNSTPIHESITITLPGKRNNKSLKKRKRESDMAAEPGVESSTTPLQPGPKKIKLSLAPKPSNKLKETASLTKTTTVTTTTLVPLAPAGPSPAKALLSRTKEPASPTDMRGLPIIPTAAQSRPRRVSNIVHSTETSNDSSPATVSTSKEVKIDEPVLKDRDLRPRSRGSMSASNPNTKAASAEPTSKQPARDQREKRRASVVEAAHPASDPAVAGASRSTRANRRPAPGFVTAAEDGKGKVSVGKRKAAPKRGSTSKQGLQGVIEEVDVVDPNEPRYCICGDVSWGIMVACENPECEREWFHLGCVDLIEPPSRRQMWYCPECREKLGVFANGDPLVVGSIRTR